LLSETFEHKVLVVFIKIANHFSEIKDSQKIRIWIYRITRNAIIDHYRRQRPTDELQMDLQIRDEYDEQDLSKDSSCIKPMIEQLPDKYREVIELAELNELSQKQLSERLGLSLSGAKSRVQRGRQKLKELLVSCCHIETDRYGNIVDYQKVIPNENSCRDNGRCGCENPFASF
jgi:RNA polymerase sigma-70 factor, ECF subfamily